jgi:hypothetical protein
VIEMKRKRRAVRKEPIDPERIRHIPEEGFSWVDRRFVRDGFIDRLSPEATLLYFFLAAVSDALGLSFYADPTISKILKLDQEELSGARSRLIHNRLILYQHPLYQVLPLPSAEEKPCERAFSSFSRTRRGGDPMSLGEILRLAMAEGRTQQGGQDNEAERNGKDMEDESNE